MCLPPSTKTSTARSMPSRSTPPCVIEILVLGRDEGLLDQRRNGRTRQIEPPLLGIFGEHRTIRGMDAGHHRRLIILQLRVIRQILLEFPDRHAGGGRRNDENDRKSRERKSEKSGDIAHTVFQPSGAAQETVCPCPMSCPRERVFPMERAVRGPPIGGYGPEHSPACGAGLLC